jgi:hypothetical protein
VRRGRVQVVAGSVTTPSGAAEDLARGNTPFASQGPAALGIAFTLSRRHLIEGLGTFLPIRLGLGGGGWVEVEAIDSVRYEPKRGLTVSCEARAHYPLPLLPDHFTIKRAILTVSPKVVPGDNGPVLGFELEFEEFDVKYLPELFDDVLAARLNRVLRERLRRVAWDFSRSLGHSLDLPKKLLRPRGVVLGPVAGSVEVAVEGIVFHVSLPFHFVHEASHRSEAQAEVPPPPAIGDTPSTDASIA